MTRKLSYKRLGLSLLVLLVAGVTIHFVHAYQMRRNAGAFLFQADQAAAAGDIKQALVHMERYLVYVPGDTDALAKFSGMLLSDQLPPSPRRMRQAVEVMEQVLRREPGRQDLRRKLIRLTVDLGQFGTAQEHIKTLAQAEPLDSELTYLRGRCQEADGQHAAAAADYQKAIETAAAETPPYLVACYLRRAELLRRRLGQAAEADKVLQGLIERAPDQADVLLLRAELAASKANVDEARKLMGRAIQLHSQDSRLYPALAQLEFRGGRHAEGVAALRQGLDALAKPGPAWLVQMADLALDANELTLARQTVARLEKLEVLPALLDYFQGRLLMSDRRWLDASRKLEAARPLLRDPDLVKKTDLALGLCCEQLGNRELQLGVYRRALAVDPGYVPARLALAAALANAGRIDEALEAYRRVGATSPGLQLAIARLLVQRTLRQPAAERRWAEAEEAVKQAAAALPDSGEVLSLRVEVLVGQGKVDEGRKLLEAQRDQDPKKLEPWLLLAALADSQKEHERAGTLLTQAREQLGDSADLRLAQARHRVSQGGPGGSAALAELEKDLDKLPEIDRSRLQRGLAEAYGALGATTQAARLWNQVAEHDAHDIRVWAVLFEHALQGDNDGEMQRVRDKIRALEGPDGAMWRWCEAARLIHLVEKGGPKASLDSAQELLAEVVKRRPQWSGGLLLSARIHELQGHPDRAVDHYQEAIKAGELRPEVIQRTARLLFERRRYAEADELIRKLPTQAPLSGDLGRLASDHAFRNQDPKRALQLAQAVAGKSTDYRDQVWLGQLYWAAGQLKEAELALRQAVRQADQAPAAWVSLVLFLAGTDRKKEAEQTIELARSKLPAAEAPLALAQCYEVIGQPDAAEKHFRAAVDARPDDAALWRSLAQFYLRGAQPTRAVAPLRSLLALPKLDPAQAGWARRNLALALAASRQDKQVEEALALIEDNIAKLGDNSEDTRTKAVVLASIPERRNDAIRMLEGLSARQTLAPADQFVLVQLYEAKQDWTRARERMLSLLAAHGNNARYVAHYVRSLLQQEELGQAEFWLNKLEQLEPNAPSSVVLRTQLWQARKQTAEAVAFLRKYAERKDAKVDLVAFLLDSLREYAAAEPFHRKHAAESKQPEAVLPLAQNLAHQNRLAEALDLCEQAWQTCPPERVATACVAVLRAGKPGPEQIRRVDQMLETAQKKTPSVALLLMLADLRDVQERYGEAAALYRQVLDKDRRNVVAMNNLAWLLALQGKGPEALELINTAIGIAGPMPALLDTRGVVYLALGQGTQAVNDIKTAVGQQPTAVRQFHLARAHALAKDRGAANKELARAKELGLEQAPVHPLERAALDRLKRELTDQ